MLLDVFSAAWLELILLLPFVLFKVLDFVLELIHDLILQLNTQITVFVANLLLYLLLLGFISLMLHDIIRLLSLSNSELWLLHRTAAQRIIKMIGSQLVFVLVNETKVSYNLRLLALEIVVSHLTEGSIKKFVH